MMGWIAFALLLFASMALLWLLRFPKGLWSFVAAAGMLGAAGYVAQGRPGLAGSPVVADAQPLEVDPDMVAMREAMFGRFNAEDAYFKISDAMLRSGSRASAVKALVGATGRYPDNAALWTMLGVAFAEHDGNMVSPASMQAFQRALKLAPNHPGPWYFLGLAQARAGQFEAARGNWAKALERTAPDLAYRPILADQLGKLDMLIKLRAEMARQAPPATAP